MKPPIKNIVRQFQVHYLALGYFRSLFGCEFYHLGIHVGQAVYLAHVNVKCVLVDVAGGNQFLVDDGADVQFLCQRNVRYIFHLGNGFFMPSCLASRQARILASELSVSATKASMSLNIFLTQNFRIAGVAVYYHGV